MVSLITLIIYIVILGLVLWLFNTQFPLPAWVRTVINVLAVLFTIIWLLQMVGFNGPSLPRFR